LKLTDGEIESGSEKIVEADESILETGYLPLLGHKEIEVIDDVLRDVAARHQLDAVRGLEIGLVHASLDGVRHERVHADCERQLAHERKQSVSRIEGMAHRLLALEAVTVSREILPVRLEPRHRRMACRARHAIFSRERGDGD